MKFQNIFTIFLLLFSLSFQAQQDTIKIELKALKDIPKENFKKMILGMFLLRRKAKSKNLRNQRRKVVVMDELFHAKTTF